MRRNVAAGFLAVAALAATAVAGGLVARSAAGTSDAKASPASVSTAAAEVRTLQATTQVDGTLGYARGHGCNLALLRQRILAAREAGCHTIFAESIIGPEEGIATAGRNLVRAGFIPACHSMYWQRPRL